ncbi:MCE family protein [Rhodococcus sp. D2-41]|uniref:MCE family protein n=1 Tax=Speluncibacter jeojiensis TaxID=2710754 RepID=A0A9X4RFD2_9ACTN|nr:MCE family protein [Rhodococcus sp. D2-41]MDG3009165.1 MCE family protein [Rhodococcus sp. D2-41]MDG3016162.1 MCE family protein [Corynebacteriales bacterium D3-21]
MTSKLVKTQIVVFVLIAVLGIVYVGAKYVRLPNMLGFGQYTVNLELASSGGIFQNAEVTYRGVPVGRVGDLSLTPTGLQVQLLLDTGGPKIPASSRAVVADRSAIGEQFVDLQPSTDKGPYLTDGSVIAQNKTSTPVPVQDLFANVTALVKSVPVDSLHTAFTELGKAFNGQGQNLQSLVDSVDNLSQAGFDNLPQTSALIADSNPVLQTQSDQSSAIEQFSHDLKDITAQLKSSDPDIRRLIDNGKPASDQVGDLVNTSGRDVTTLLRNTAPIADVFNRTSIGLRVLLAALPALGAAAPAIAPGDGTIHMGLVLETNNPVACTRGYEGSQKILAEMKAKNPNFDPNRDEFPVNLDAHCAVPEGNPTAVRGSQNAVLVDPDTPQPWDNKPKVDPEKLNLTPIATQLATLMGITTR